MKIFLTITLFLFCLTACNYKKKQKNIVLKIDKLEVTRYEFQKNKSRFIKKDEEKSEKAIYKWKQDYLDRCFIIADAYYKRYDTILGLQMELQHISDLMMVQQYGYLWNKVVAPFVDSFTLVTKDKVAKRQIIFYFDFISTTDYEKLLALIHYDTISINLEKYNVLKSKCHLYDFLGTGYMSQQWPFISFWDYKEYLFNLKEGEVTSLIHVNDKYNFLYLDHIENVEITDEDIRNLQTELKMGIEYQIDKEKTNEMNIAGNPVINIENIEILSNFISEGNNLSEFKENLELIRYNLDNELKKIKIKSFLEYYKYLPLRKNIEDKETLIWYINQYYYNDYLRVEANKLGLYQLDTFLLDQKNFKNNLVYREYMKNEIINKIEVDSSEIVNYYNGHMFEFSQPKTYTLDMYVFTDKTNALKNVRIISDYLKYNQPEKAKDLSVINDLQEVFSDFKIYTDNNGAFSEEFLNTLLNLKMETLSTIPLELDGKYVLLYKTGEEGQSIRKFLDVYDVIANIIKQQKIEKKRQERLTELKKKYPIEIDKTGI